MTPVAVTRGDGPIILGMPHAGTWLPDDVSSRLNGRGQRLADTDWHIDRVYDGLLDDATVVRAQFHRYVIDANRDPVGNSLYPGQNTTGLVPLTDFDGHPIWALPPHEADVETRLRQFHKPYHDAMSREISRVRNLHGYAILYDCHSIRSSIPHLFEGRLPDLNIGTNDGRSCDAVIEAIVAERAGHTDRYTTILNGRFKGGWTTRHYGKPHLRTHGIQMEIAQAAYLDKEEAPWTFSEAKADRLREVLAEVLRALSHWEPADA
ncbi:MAG: N-formylglutamate deformylase [Pseudomonadota bacterium]